MVDYARVLSHVPLMQHALDVLMHWQLRQAHGDPPLDFQERAFLALVDQVDALCAGDPSRHDLRRAAVRGERLLRVHFACEERMLSAVRYPDLPGHVAEHREILADMAGLRERLERRGSEASAAVLGRSLLTFLLGVAMGHMTVADGDWARYLADQCDFDTTGCA